MEDPEENNMDESSKNRQELLRRIEVQRENIENFVRRVRPRSVRLANISIISSAIAAVLTAGPAFGGLSFAGAVQQHSHYRVLPLCGESSVSSPCLYRL